ncbi:hypothetical protein [Streptomyces sp. NPDC058773]|uniref:hypothetical protein n=1 Tax=Streptomyces sp. NPDC058773 TaxID=3346632 RepID=UPI00369847B6
MAKIAFTLLWAGVLIAASRALDDVTWAQYLTLFVLAGVYACTVDKLPGSRDRSARERPET